ncbi:hypothetical protein M5K25_025359 [Dendrobium thyrsiflorum]|uniref:Uncharacterized protein n=1 Tax=Dendrobium thyrsiflorum TaxID=117978 RepID=A0ABD0U3X0_DENTH
MHQSQSKDKKASIKTIRNLDPAAPYSVNDCLSPPSMDRPCALESGCSGLQDTILQYLLPKGNLQLTDNIRLFDALPSNKVENYIDNLTNTDIRCQKIHRLALKANGGGVMINLNQDLIVPSSWVIMVPSLLSQRRSTLILANELYDASGAFHMLLVSELIYRYDSLESQIYCLDLSVARNFYY